ncbi:hypothetical protein X777_09930 [Ooceraea biroi]|uniref:Uncharacterized protein n=1 Tax=Ooceraea biroi TaxID=2015173 RepID=A0A026W5H3_OOCBI|nr:hypothetical protein X777_09930 [Ooceraea biroi]
MSFNLFKSVFILRRTLSQKATGKVAVFSINVLFAFRCTPVGLEQLNVSEQLYLPEVQRRFPEDVGSD